MRDSGCAHGVGDIAVADFPVAGTPYSWFVKGAVRRIATDAIRPWAVHRIRARIRMAPRLHLGCGPLLLPGWTNVDLVGRVRVDAVLNLSRPLPIPTGSVDAIYHEHVLEHLSYERGLSLLYECARVLRPGGVIRVGVPDFGRYARSYVGDGGFLESVKPGRPSRLFALAEVVYSHGHRSVWDAETLVFVLKDAGLRAEERQVGVSLLDPCPDHRPEESLYVEATKG